MAEEEPADLRILLALVVAQEAARSQEAEEKLALAAADHYIPKEEDRLCHR